MAEAMDDPRVEAHRLPDDGRFPNSLLPLLVYCEVRPDGPDLAAGFERLFARNGWTGAWRGGVYGSHHCHSTAHEVLGCVRGNARLRLGGPSGLALEATPGTVIVIPAGVAHCAETLSQDFQVVGATDQGRTWDINKGEPGERERTLPAIASVPQPEADPVLGRNGPLRGQWSA